MTTKLETLERAMVESPEDISEQYIFKDKFSLWVGNKEEVISFRVGRTVAEFESCNRNDSDNGDTNGTECLFKLTYRLTGRATQAEERILKSIKYLIGDEEVTPKTKYKELKMLFDEYGWYAFDRDGKILFDNLNAIYGEALFDNDNAVQKTTFDSKPSAVAKRDEETSNAGDPSHKDDRGFDKEGSGTFDLRPKPSLPYLPDEVQPVNDGVNASNKSPEQCAANFAAWGLKYPESEYPDSCADGTGFIQGPWEPSDYEKKTDRTDVLANKLKVLLDFRNQDPIEPLQTNIFIGDNDNYIYEEGDPNKFKRDAESEMPMRPSENEMLARIVSVNFDRRYVARPDSYDMDYRLIPKRGFTVGPDGKLVPLCGDVEWAADGAIKRMGHLLFNSADKDLADRFSKHRGEMTQYISGGKPRPVKDTPYEIPGGPPAVTVLKALFDKKLGAVPSNSDLKKWKPAERNELEQKAETRWKKLEVKLHGSVYGEGKERCEYYERRLQGSELDTWPILPSTSLSLNDALVFCKLPPVPVNDNAIRLGLPYGVKSASQLSMAADCLKVNARAGKAAKTQTSVSMHPYSPEDILLRKEENELRCRTESRLSVDEVSVKDALFSSATVAEVGMKTGDEGKHHRTQEKNANGRLLRVAAKYSAISAEIAA